MLKSGVILAGGTRETWSVKSKRLKIATLPHHAVSLHPQRLSSVCGLQHFQILVRDIYAFYPLVIKYVDLHRSHWLKNPSVDAENLYLCVADVFNLWSKSQVGSLQMASVFPSYFLTPQ